MRGMLVPSVSGCPLDGRMTPTAVKKTPSSLLLLLCFDLPPSLAFPECGYWSEVSRTEAHLCPIQPTSPLALPSPSHWPRKRTRACILASDSIWKRLMDEQRDGPTGRLG